MQQAHDCDMIIVHDDDLERIDGIGEGTVSGYSIVSYIIFLILLVTRIPPTRSGHGSLPRVQHRDT